MIVLSIDSEKNTWNEFFISLSRILPIFCKSGKGLQVQRSVRIFALESYPLYCNRKTEKRGNRAEGFAEWDMRTEMQIFVRKLITRINSSQNVQTVCQAGWFCLFSQTKLYIYVALASAHASICRYVRVCSMHMGGGRGFMYTYCADSV